MIDNPGTGGASPSQCKHDTTVTESYYGYNCSACGEFLYPYGSEPWAYLTDEEEERLAREEAFYNGWGTCAYCGGEWGDGWSTCTCEVDE